jgi:fucose 4-O-acetylase-like acetyltransferase
LQNSVASVEANAWWLENAQWHESNCESKGNPLSPLTQQRPMGLPTFLSDKFKFWSFISMVLLVFVHGYTVEPRYLQPWTLPQELPLGFTSYVEYLLSNGLLRFRIPMLFAISGYLFAWFESASYASRIQKRVRTLLVPYFAWSGILLLVMYALEMHPTGRAWLSASGINQMSDTKVLLHDYGWGDLMGRWLVVPAPYQLWFLRVLFVLNVLYPLILLAVLSKFGRWLFFVFAFFFWFSNAHLFFIEGEGLLFFSLGVLMQKKAFNIEVPAPWLNPKAWATLWLATAGVKTWLAFEGLGLMGESVYPLMAHLHKVCVLSGVIAAWFGGDFLVRTLMAKPWFVWLSAFSFMIYATHAPLVAVFIDPTLRLLAGLPDPHLATYILLPCTLITVAVLMGAGLRRFTPQLYGWLTGGRGL